MSTTERVIPLIPSNGLAGVNHDFRIRIIDQWTVISDCITKPDEAPQAIDILTTDMFTEPGCRDVFKVFVTLQADGLPTDINHAIERLETSGKLNHALGVRLHQAACDARAPQPVSYYAQRVLGASSKTMRSRYSFAASSEPAQRRLTVTRRQHEVVTHQLHALGESVYTGKLNGNPISSQTWEKLRRSFSKPCDRMLSQNVGQ